MREQLEGLKQEALAKVTAAQSEKELQDVRVAYLGKKKVRSRKYYVGWGSYLLKSDRLLAHWLMSFVMRLKQQLTKKNGEDGRFCS